MVESVSGMDTRKSGEVTKMVMDKKALGAWRTNFDLHVLLVMKQEQCAKPLAMVQAYSEGVEGLAKRLAPTTAKAP